MRGEICVGFASVLSFTSVLLMIFVHVGQINTSNVPRGVAMAKMNVSGYGNALQTALLVPIAGLYTSNASTPLESGAGLRQIYKFGLYSHCGYIDDKNGVCTNHTTGEQFRPYDAITSDMAFNYSLLTANFIPDNTTFTDSKFLGQSSKAAYWMLLLGTICATIALVTGFAKNNFTFFISTIFSIAGSLLLLIGASIWTVLIKKSESVNSLLALSVTNIVPIGITMSTGPGLLMVWAAFACLVVSIVPYMLSCCTFRG